MFGDPFHIRYLDKFSNSLIMLERSFMLKRIPKHEPTSSYYHLVGCITECMMRSDEYNRNVHGSYAEETAPSSNGNDMDEDESK